MLQAKRFIKNIMTSQRRRSKTVFFVKEGDRLIFGFTPYLRIPAEGDIYGGIPEVHKNYTGTDFVDAMFGWRDFRTKLSFLDAVCESQILK